MDVGQKIRDKRKKLGLTTKEFSDALNMGKNGDRPAGWRPGNRQAHAPRFSEYRETAAGR